MANKIIDLMDMPDEIMVLVEHPSGVSYRTQVGGVTCWGEELEGVLAPIDLGGDLTDLVRNLPYPSGREGISPEIADSIDQVLASRPSTAWVKVDRDRMGQSWEAWVYVLIDSPEDTSTIDELYGPYSGSLFGFGKTRGVLTWINSD